MVSGLSGKFLDCLDSFGVVRTVSALSRQFWYGYELKGAIFTLLQKLSGFLQKLSGQQCWHADEVFVTLLLGRFVDPNLETHLIVGLFRAFSKLWSFIWSWLSVPPPDFNFIWQVHSLSGCSSAFLLYLMATVHESTRIVRWKKIWAFGVIQWQLLSKKFDANSEEQEKTRGPEGRNCAEKVAAKLCEKGAARFWTSSSSCRLWLSAGFFLPQNPASYPWWAEFFNPRHSCKMRFSINVWI